MIIQKKYYMILLLSMASISYGMDREGEGYKKIMESSSDPSIIQKRLEIQKLTRQLNSESEIQVQSNGHYKYVGQLGIITVVARQKLINPDELKARL